jgi:hypothetical protein
MRFVAHQLLLLWPLLCLRVRHFFLVINKDGKGHVEFLKGEKLDQMLWVHPLNDTCTLKSASALSYILHMKRMKGKEYGLNIVVASVTNLVTNYMQLLLNTHSILNQFIH